MDAGHQDAGATLVATFILSPVALLIMYPLGYAGGWVAAEVVEGLGFEISAWISELEGAVLIGLAAGALPWFLLMNVCSMAAYLGKAHC
jgi:hypothetical protein